LTKEAELSGVVLYGWQVRVITSEIDWGLNSKGQVLPGIGEFGDRYFGTD
jgi:uracil phosphoribosyltransferase